MPAEAGIQVDFQIKQKKTWIPACAGMTELEFRGRLPADTF